MFFAFCRSARAIRHVLIVIFRTPHFSSYTGRLVWRRHAHLPLPSHHVIRTTCMQILPIVEMYCKWELEEDCTSLRAFMVRFDSESELETHKLGRSLLSMLRNDDVAYGSLPLHTTLLAQPNPFDEVRCRLAAADLAIRHLHAQVHLLLPFPPMCAFACTYVVLWYTHDTQHVYMSPTYIEFGARMYWRHCDMDFQSPDISVDSSSLTCTVALRLTPCLIFQTKSRHSFRVILYCQYFFHSTMSYIHNMRHLCGSHNIKFK